MGLSCSKTQKKLHYESPVLVKSPKEIIHIKKAEKKPIPILKDLRINALYQNRVHRRPKKKGSDIFDLNDDIDNTLTHKISSFNSRNVSMKTMEKIRENNA